jgi:hypothetical protein
MSGRSHEHFCRACRTYWSPFDFPACPCGADDSIYDPNGEEAEE